jgi:hypothetical protein
MKAKSMGLLDEAHPITYGLLLWGRSEGNPGITPLFIFGYEVDRLLISLTFKIKIRFFNQVLQPGRTQQLSPTAASLPRCMLFSPSSTSHLFSKKSLNLTYENCTSIC